MFESLKKRKQIGFIIGLFFLSFFLADCSKSKNSASADLYVKAVLGIDIGGGKLLPFRTKVTRVGGQDPKSEMVKISYEGKEYEIPPRYLAETYPRQFFMVTEPQGLNFREGPGKDYKKIITLPRGTKGEVVDVDPKMQIIQKQVGYWFSSEMDGKKGWLFSGFVVLSENSDWKDSGMEPDSEEREFKLTTLSWGDQESEPMRSSSLVENEFSFSNYKIQYILESQLDEVEKSCGFDKSIQIMEKNKKVQFQGGWFHPMERDAAKNGFVFYSSNGCGCCCAPIQETLIIASNDGVRSVSYESGGQEGVCGSQEGQFLSVQEGMEYRLDAEKSILYLMRVVPVCDPVGQSVNEEESFKEFKRLGSKYFFHVFQNTNGDYSEIKKELPKREVPAEYKSAWESAKKMKREF